MYLTACGMATPVGLSFAAAAAAIRAGIAGFAELNYVDLLRKPIIGCATPIIADGRSQPNRLLAMSTTAIRDCLGDDGLANAAKVPLVLCVSQPDFSGRPADLDSWLPQAIQAELRVAFHSESTVIAQGRTGAAVGLQRAQELFERKAARQCLIVGVDSYINAAALAAVDRDRRLKTDENPDGIIPGEAAAAVLVSTQPTPGATLPIRMCGLGFAQEKVLPGDEEPITGEGLAAAIRLALAASGFTMADVDFRYSDLTGERYYFLEANYAFGRVMRIRHVLFDIWHCMDAIGDTGAAAGPCILALATAAFNKDYAPGRTVMCQFSAESGARAVVLLRREETSHGQ